MKKNSLSKIEKSILIITLSHLMNGFRYNKRTKMLHAKFIFSIEAAPYEVLKSAYEKIMQSK